MVIIVIPMRYLDVLINPMWRAQYRYLDIKSAGPQGPVFRTPPSNQAGHAQCPGTRGRVRVIQARVSNRGYSAAAGAALKCT